jgi:hypothetical protein
VRRIQITSAGWIVWLYIDRLVPFPQSAAKWSAVCPILLEWEGSTPWVVTKLRMRSIRLSFAAIKSQSHSTWLDFDNDEDDVDADAMVNRTIAPQSLKCGVVHYS